MLTHCQVQIHVGADVWRQVCRVKTNDPASVVVAARNRSRLSSGSRIRVRTRSHSLLPWRVLWDSHLDGAPLLIQRNPEPKFPARW